MRSFAELGDDIDRMLYHELAFSPYGETDAGQALWLERYRVGIEVRQIHEEDCAYTAIPEQLEDRIKVHGMGVIGPLLWWNPET